MNKYDYFELSDMRYHGAGVWAKVRATLRKQGYRVKDTYGQYSHTRSGNSNAFIELDVDGDLLFRLYKPKGNLVKIIDVLTSVHRRLKLRTYNNPLVLNQVIDYLISLGYKPISDELFNGSVYGVHASTDGLIYSVTRSETFDYQLKDAVEIEYTNETIIRLSNFTEKRKVIDVLGHKVHEDALLEFLKNNLAN